MFIDMFLGDFLKRLLFMVVETIPQDEIDATVDEAVAMFMKSYGVARQR